MNIAIIGYGKMGREIESVARMRGHHILLIIDEDNQNELNESNLSRVDVAMEFTASESVEANLLKCFETNTPVVCGTTGWQEGLERIKNICDTGSNTLFYTPNFSVGVYLFSKLNKIFASLMNSVDGYDVRIREIHHQKKTDKPSGTAIALANHLIGKLDRKNQWESDPPGSVKPGVIPIESVRKGQVPGTHTVCWESEVNLIELKHVAKSRKGFAQGAMMAAEFITGKKGYFEMTDMIGLDL